MITLKQLQQDLANLNRQMARLLELRQKAWEASDPNVDEINEALDIGYKVMEAKRAKLLEQM